MLEGSWVILEVPCGGSRLVQLKAQEQIDLGRYGRFAAKELIGQPDGAYFCIENEGKLKRTTALEVKSKGFLNAVQIPETPDGITATNQSLSDTNTSQRLGTTEVEALKQQVDQGRLGPQEVVKTLIANSETFEQKNAFSQIKYVQRKQRKFLRWFALRQVTLRTLTVHFMARDPRKILDLRLDALSQILSLSNVAAMGAKVLLWDETVGFMTGAVLGKLRGDGAALVHVHPDRQMQTSALMYFNFDEKTRANLLYPLPIDSINEPLPPDDFIDTNEADPHRLAIQRQRYDARRNRKMFLKSLLEASAFDSLIIVVNRTDPLSLLETLSRHLRPSSPVVVYSPWRDLLLPVFMNLRSGGQFVDVTLHESFLRPYQVAPGRIHPMMNCNGHSGAILVATKILPLPKSSS